MPTPATVLDHLDADRAAAVARLSDFLRIPSISAQPAHAEDCRLAAEWAAAALDGIGLAAEVILTEGHPVVLAHRPGPAGAPHVLFYGHYDVQPPEPLAPWTSAPFEPVVVDGANGPRIVARGAVDDKGQASMILEALRAWQTAGGGIPLPVTVLLEGEEEVGSVNLEPFLRDHRDRLGADVVVISDTNMWDIETPAITTRLRGLLYTQVTVRCASRDLHSGLFGGLALNPLNVLTRVLGDLHDADGRIAVPGFYDKAREVPPAQAAAWRALGFDEAAFLGAVGLSAPGGERGRPGLEKLWGRPTADINGIWGGYMDAGAKTVIAREAHAKVSFRLVPDQDPLAIYAAFQEFVRARLPDGAAAEIVHFGAGPGFEVPTDSAAVRAAQAALAAEYGRPAVLMGSGGSIPVVESFRRVLGIDCLLMGFGLDDDQIHGPNEKFDLRCFHHGARAHARLIGQLADGA